MRTWRCLIDENARPGRSGWLHAHPDRLDQYAKEIDDLVDRLKGVLRDVSAAARFRAPSVDPATVRATQRLAEDAHDRPGTPVRSITEAIERLVHQAETARANAQNYREIERRAIERLRDARRDTS